MKQLSLFEWNVDFTHHSAFLWIEYWDGTRVLHSSSFWTAHMFLGMWPDLCKESVNVW